MLGWEPIDPMIDLVDHGGCLGCEPLPDEPEGTLPILGAGDDLGDLDDGEPPPFENL